MMSRRSEWERFRQRPRTSKLLALLGIAVMLGVWRWWGIASAALVLTLIIFSLGGWDYRILIYALLSLVGWIAWFIIFGPEKMVEPVAQAIIGLFVVVVLLQARTSWQQRHLNSRKYDE